MKEKRGVAWYDDEEDEDAWSMSCWQKFRLFMKQTCKDICRHKCQFCLSFCSVFVVVLSILIVVSITEKGPTIFLRLSEKTTGEYDAIFFNRQVDWTVGLWTAQSDDPNYANAFLNYQLV